MRNTLVRRFHRQFWLLALVALLAAVLTAHGQDLSGQKTYVTIKSPLKTGTPEKIEVIEFFSYACSHCYSLHPTIKQWAAKLPEDVAFRRIPVSGRGAYAMMARAYHALDIINAQSALDDAVFLAIHSKTWPEFNDPPTLAQWVAEKGFGPEKKFLDAFYSEEVTAKTKDDQQIFDNSGASGVPGIMVDGKYLVSGDGVGTFYDLLARTDEIIAMRRAERAKLSLPLAQ